MATTKIKSPFARRCVPQLDLLWELLEHLNTMIAVESRVIGWPELGSLYIHQCCPDPIEWLGRSNADVSGPVKLNARGRFFSVYDPPRDSVWCWGLLKPVRNDSACRWATARVNYRGNKLSIVTQRYVTAREASSAAEVHPLEMMVKLHKLAAEVRDRCADDLKKAECLKVTTETQLHLLGGVIEGCALKHMEVDIAMAGPYLLDQLKPDLLRHDLFGLSNEAIVAIAAAQAGL